MTSRFHIGLLAVLLIVFCIAYAVVAITAPETAQALGIGFVGVVLLASVLLRLLRRI